MKYYENILLLLIEIGMNYLNPTTLIKYLDKYSLRICELILYIKRVNGFLAPPPNQICKYRDQLKISALLLVSGM